jgi:serine/threonine protein kinase
MSLKDY